MPQGEKGWTFYLSYSKSNLKLPHFTEVFWKIISWLGLKNLFQTFEQQDLSKTEQEIAEIRELLGEEAEPPELA